MPASRKKKDLEKFPGLGPITRMDARSEIPQLSEEHGERIEAASNSVDLVSTIFDFLEKIHKRLTPAADGVSKAIPPLRVAMISISNIYQFTQALFSNKESQLSRARKMSFSIAIIALTIIGVAVPVLGGAMLVASIGVELFKETGNWFDKFKAHRRAKAHHKHLTHQLHLARHHNHTHKVAELEEKLAQAGEHLAEHLHEGIEKTMDVGLSMVSVIGAALAVTPLAPIGIGILIGAAVVGFAFKLGFGAFKRWSKNKSKQNEIKSHAPKPTPSKKVIKDKDGDEDEEGVEFKENPMPVLSDPGPIITAHPEPTPEPVAKPTPHPHESEAMMFKAMGENKESIILHPEDNQPVDMISEQESRVEIKQQTHTDSQTDTKKFKSAPEPELHAHFALEKEDKIERAKNEKPVSEEKQANQNTAQEEEGEGETVHGP